MIKTKIQKIVLVLAVLAMSIPLAFAADYLSVQAYATDTVAGYPSALRTSIVNPYQDVRFIVEKPDGTVVQIPAQADLDGIAKTDLYGHQTKIAGEYKVAIVYPGSSTSSPQTTFRVYADKMSPTQSSLRSTLRMAEAGKDVTFLVATLYDQYKNPISSHRVNLISSRSEDSIEILQNGLTDKNGRVNFKVTSKYAGISVFSAMDVTLGQLLSDREEIVFFAPSPVAKNPFAANLFGADLGGDGTTLPGPVDHFEISGLPATAETGEQLSLTVTAQDKDNNTAKNYTGTILISVPDDENATLPNSGEYTFKAADQGAFTFSLSLVFSKLGKQAVQVFDKSSFKISGEQEIEIVSDKSVTPSGTSSNLVIKSPADGSSLGSSLVILTGQGDENIDLKVFDNDTKIGDTETDSDGFFSYEAKSLSSGSHTFYVMSDNNEVSASVAVTIDTVAPALNTFEMDAEGSVAPATKVTIELQSEKSLDQAKVRVQGITEDMEESDTEPGTYSVMVTAPAKDGNYPVDVILVDALSNKSEFSAKGTITVSTPEPDKPPKVENPDGTADDTKVQLTWSDVTGHDNAISKYRIYYGTELDKLESTVDTTDSTPSWELRDLTNGTQYFIAVTAIDSKGLESDEYSTTIAITPVAPDLCADVECGDNGTCEEGLCVCETGWSGELCDTEEVIETSETTETTAQASTYDGTAILSWSAFSGVQAYYYKVFIGFSPGRYSDYLITQDSRTTVTVSDLVPDMTYYFAVVALDRNKKQISQLSQEIIITPEGTAFRPAAPSQVTYVRPAAPAKAVQTKTGSETIWVVLASLAFAYFLYRHKRKMLFRIKS